MLSFFSKNKEIILKAPFEGEIVDIEEVSDPVFSSKMLGDGVAIKPTSNRAVAPCDGEITQIFPTNHAFGITTKEGLEILVHIGIDTVNLKGEGFKRLVEVGTNVKKGTEIIEVDLDYINQSGKDSITPIVITNMDQVERIDKNLNNREEILKIEIKK
ncbi:MAG: PTS glucose transporter subunit IIA [Marinisporobacter sp.]|jgi:glucose-specific phosphotransferase system IIA component|nr:PTS glucose transporter subunit IIA [Marinisporobacter sp.]